MVRFLHRKGMMLSGNSRIAEVLRERPAVMGWLNASGLAYRGCLEMTCEDFCAAFGLGCEDWLRFVSQLPFLADDTDFNAVPLHDLADRLTAEHGRIRGRDLPALERLLQAAARQPGNATLTGELEPLFRTFRQAVLAHLREEEERIFPRILELETRVCAPGAFPGSQGLEVAEYAHHHGHDLEARFEAMAAGMRHRIAAHMHPPSRSLERLCRALEIVERRLARHAALEADVFFPRAAELERRLSGPHPVPKESVSRR